jgi:hypothetical protein
MRWAGKEIVPDYTSNSNPDSGYNPDSSYEFDFDSDPEPEPENTTTEQPLSGPATSLVITSTPTGRFVYWTDRKPADLTDGNSRCVTYLDSLPFQEGTPLAPAGEHNSTEVATIDSGLGTPDRQVFVAAGETPGPSGTRPDRYFEDISADELSANTPADETGGAGGSRAVAAHGDAGGEAATTGAPHTGLAGEPVAEAIAEAEATQTSTSLVSHAVATMPAVESKKFDATSSPRQAKMTASPPSLLGFAICFSRRNSNLWGSPSTMRSKTQFNGSDAMPSPSKMLVATTTRSASTSHSV